MARGPVKAVEDQVEDVGKLPVSVPAGPLDVLPGVLGQVRVRGGVLPLERRGQVGQVAGRDRVPDLPQCEADQVAVEGVVPVVRQPGGEAGLAFAVQIAKALGAEVTGVCSTRNVDLVRSIGADRVIDYTREDFTASDQRYDMMLDIAGNRSWSECRRVLKPQATAVVIGGPKTNRLVGPLGHLIRQRLAAIPSSQSVTSFIATLNQADLVALQELLESGKVTPVIDRSYKLGEAADALRYVGEGHARGKVVLTV